MTHPSELELSAFLAGELAAPAGDRVGDHLNDCPQCRALVERITSVPAELAASLLAATGANPSGENFSSVPQVTGYTDLRELGRGGCGIVYRAYDLAADRLVAIKVLRGGPLASRSERAWFLAEAETAAKLRHPNIVEILAVGGTHAVPYYVMEYLAGGSLAGELNGTPLAPRIAARLVETLAAAVHAAHLCGIVHRDLKPGNVLLTGAQDPFAIPKVSDFGMAKGTNPEEFPTPTQAVVGTPSYMASEQAFGRSKQVGPAADVYSLGAILYELLTGRPPYRGETPYETLLQVRSFDLVWPRRLRPDLSPALEAVCLKCLERHPQHRYPTAAALAEDLGRFSSGTRVLARLPGPVRRAARWARANPAAAKMAAALAAVVIAGVFALSALWLHAEDQRDKARRSADAAHRSRVAARQSLARYAEATKALFRSPDSITSEEKAAFVTAVAEAEEVLAAPTGDPDEEHAAAYSLLKLADSLHTLRESGAALRACRAALEVLARLTSGHPDRVRYAFDYSQGCSQCGGVLGALGKAEESEAHIREAIRVGDGVQSRRPDSDECRGALANYRVKLARILRGRGEFSEAEALVANAVAESRRLCERYPDDPFRWAFVHANMRTQADLRFVRDRSVEGYIEQARFGLSMSAHSGPNIRRPDWGRVLVTCSEASHAAAALDHLGRGREADALSESSLTAAEEFCRAVPDDPLAQFTVAQRLSQSGRRQWADKPDAAHARFLRAVSAYENARTSNTGVGSSATVNLAQLLATCPDPQIRNVPRAIELVRTHSLREMLGPVLYAGGEYAEARKALAGKPREPGALLDIRRRAYLVLTLLQLGEKALARNELDGLTGDLRRETEVNWPELSDWATAWTATHGGEPPTLWPAR